MATSLKTVLVPPEGIKIKHNNILATKSKAEIKLAPWSLDKRLATHHIVSFMNQKWKVEFRMDGNQAA